MINRYQILIIGGGTAGLMVASSLHRKNPKLHVGIVEPSDRHWYQPAWTMVGGGTYNYEKTSKPMKTVIPKEAYWIKDQVIYVNAKENTITISNGKQINYEYLVIATGLKFDASLVEGMSEALGNGVVCSNYTDPNHTW